MVCKPRPAIRISGGMEGVNQPWFDGSIRAKAHDRSISGRYLVYFRLAPACQSRRGSLKFSGIEGCDRDDPSAMVKAQSEVVCGYKWRAGMPRES